MNTTHDFMFLKQINCEFPILRSLAEGRDFRPDWRPLLTDAYLAQLKQPSAANGPIPEELKRILDPNTGEQDEMVRQLLQFHYGIPFEGKPALDWALRCGLKSPEAALAIKAMLVADYSVEEIADELSTSIDNIKAFEQVFFDVRPYAKDRLFLQKICYGKHGHRLLQVAFQRGRVGVEEVVLRRRRKDEGRITDVCLGLLLQRVKDGILDREAANIPPDESDAGRLIALSRVKNPQMVPYLSDTEKSHLESLERVEQFTPAERRRLSTAFEVLRGALKRLAGKQTYGGGAEAPARSDDVEKSDVGNTENGFDPKK
jgi:hypothetical protein